MESIKLTFANETVKQQLSKILKELVKPTMSKNITEYVSANRIQHKIITVKRGLFNKSVYHSIINPQHDIN